VTADALLVFVKAPRPGAVKTRLVPDLGPENAATLYRLLAEEEVQQTTPQRGEYDRLFFHAPAAARSEMEAWLGSQAWFPQEGADLGARMAGAFETAFSRGARRAAVIGTDVPGVSREIVLEALAALDDHDVALGPTHDGGYYLLALKRPRGELFEGIAWSTPGVLPATLNKAHSLNLSVYCLSRLTDIDTLEDVRAAWTRLRPLLSRTPALDDALSRALERR
jgi:rSAM/selenodomain-associated transferase 1